MAKIKKNLKNLVEFSKEAMNNSIEGLEKINEMVVDYRSFHIDPVKELEGDNVAAGDNKTTRPNLRTRSRSSSKGTSRFIMEELEEINRISIQKNKDLVLSLNCEFFCFSLFVCVFCLCFCSGLIPCFAVVFY